MRTIKFEKMLTDLKKTIDRKEIDLLPPYVFTGEVKVIEEERQVGEAADFLSKHTCLGFDTETRPSFRKGSNNKVALLQISTADEAFLFRLGATGLPLPLKHVLSRTLPLKIGVGITDDIKALRRISDFAPAGVIDLQNYAVKFGIEEKSLKKLSAIVLGIKVSKSQQLSNWENPILTEAQQRYAATDAYVCLQIFNKLSHIKPL